jgi:flagellar biosynthesis component FlhA
MNDEKIDNTENLQQKEYIEKEKAFYSAMVSA